MALLAIAAPVAAKDNNEKLMALTVDQFAKKMETRDDDLQTNVLYSTKSGYRKMQSTQGFLGTDSDLWLHGSIDKKTGNTIFVVIAQASWVGGAALYDSATYTTPSGPVDARVMDGAGNVGACVAAGCSFDATMGVEVPEATLRTISASTVPWRFRFRSTSGSEFENAMAPVEVTAILAAVDRYRLRIRIAEKETPSCREATKGKLQFPNRTDRISAAMAPTPRSGVGWSLAFNMPAMARVRSAGSRTESSGM